MDGLIEKMGRKVLKIILTIGVFVYFQYHGVSHENFSIHTVTGGILLALIAYLFFSLFGLMLSLSRNYLITIMATFGIFFFVCFKIDGVVAKIPWLSETGFAVLLIIFAGFLLIKDILFIKAVLSAPAPEQAEMPAPPIAGGYMDKDKRSQMKADPQMVLNVSNMLEAQWGRKPSYEEIMDYMDKMLIPEEKQG